MLHYALPRSYHNECLKISLELVWSLQTTNGRPGQFYPQTRQPAAQNHRANCAHVTAKQ